MAKDTNGKSDMDLVQKEPSRAQQIAAKGIKTGNDFASMMSALMSDLAEGRIQATTANAMCNAGGKLLKVVEMQYRYGGDGAEKKQTLQLAD